MSSSEPERCPRCGQVGLCGPDDWDWTPEPAGLSPEAIAEVMAVVDRPAPSEAAERFRVEFEDEQSTEPQGSAPKPPEPEYLTSDLTDEALAEVHRWHAIVHPFMAQAGVYEPERNPSGCDRFFCLTHVVECSAVAAPRWYDAGYQRGISEGRRLEREVEASDLGDGYSEIDLAQGHWYWLDELGARVMVSLEKPHILLRWQRYDELDAPIYVVDDAIRCYADGCRCGGNYLDIARRTTPWGIARSVAAHLLDLEPASPEGVPHVQQ